MRVCQSATLGGTVVNGLTQQPIQDATVSWGVDPSQQTQTDANGRYLLVNIPAGYRNGPNQITLSATAPNFSHQSRYITVFCGATITSDFGHTVSASSTISGHATNATTGQPIGGAWVLSEFGTSTSTDASGFYQFTNVPLAAGNSPRDWRITIAPTDFPQQTRVATISANQTTIFDFTFGGTSVHTLTFTADGIPASAGWVPVVNGSPPNWSTPLTYSSEQSTGSEVTFSAPSPAVGVLGARYMLQGWTRASDGRPRTSASSGEPMCSTRRKQGDRQSSRLGLPAIPVAGLD
jgi:hypothetical protein